MTLLDTPACKRLDNFALEDLNGNVWEFRKNRKGKLLLLDFWGTHCKYCVQGMPHLTNLQREVETQLVFDAQGDTFPKDATETGRLGVNVVAAEFRLTEKLVTSRSGLPVPTKLGSMSPTGSDTVAAANAGEATSAEIRTAESLSVFIEEPLLVPPR